MIQILHKITPESDPLVLPFFDLVWCCSFEMGLSVHLMSFFTTPAIKSAAVKGERERKDRLDQIFWYPLHGIVGKTFVSHCDLSPV